jgi:PhoH-like ATPase
MDHAILQTALSIRELRGGEKSILVTMDINLRIRAEAIGLQTATYESNRVELEDLNNNILEVQTDKIDQFYTKGFLELEELFLDNVIENACILMKNGSQSALGRVIKGNVVKLKSDKGYYNIKARNVEQHFALDLLLDPNVNLVTIMGKAGTGKTLMAILAGIKGILDGTYTKMLISRPIVAMGNKDIGYLPGSVEEKMNPWLKPIWDNLDFVMVTGGQDLRLVEHQIEVEPLTYIRGRSLPCQYMLIDEAQNLSPHETKTIVTRCGAGTKVVLTGDPYQIDCPYMDASSNGLSVLVKKLSNHPLVGHLQLHKGERSELATLAAENL